MGSMTPTDLMWSLYRESFKERDLVVVEDDWGHFYWGTVTTSDEGITLTRPGKRQKFLFWDEILFMAHDGFPVKAIRGLSDEEASKLAIKTPTEAIRGLLDPKDDPTRYISMGGGCPFWFGPFSVAHFLNRGNTGSQHWGEDTEELVILSSRDGAKCHVSDLSHHFLQA